MPDNMMRIAGRGKDGTAKALKTNNHGSLSTLNLGDKISFIDSNTNLNPGTPIETNYIVNDGYDSAHFNINFNVARPIKVYYKPYRLNGDNYNSDAELLIYESDGSKLMHHAEFKVSSDYYTLIVENTHPNLGAAFLATSSVTHSTTGISVISEKLDQLLNKTGIVELGTAQVDNLEAGATHRISADSDCKYIVISFYADANNDLSKGDGLILSSIKSGGLSEGNIGVLRGQTLDGYQPIFWQSGVQSGGSTPLILKTSIGFTLHFENLTGDTLSFKYKVTGHY